MPIGSRFIRDNAIKLTHLKTEVSDLLLTPAQTSALEAAGDNPLVFAIDNTISPLALALSTGTKPGLILPADKAKLNALLTVQAGAQDVPGNDTVPFLGIDFNTGFTVTRVGSLAQVKVSLGGGALLGITVGDGLGANIEDPENPLVFLTLTPSGGLKFTEQESGKTVGLNFAANNEVAVGKAVESTDSRLSDLVKSLLSTSPAFDISSSLPNGQGVLSLELVLADNNAAVEGLPVESTDDRLVKVVKKAIAGTGVTVDGSIGDGQGDVTFGLDLAVDGAATAGKALASDDSRLLLRVKDLVSSTAGLVLTNSGPQDGPKDLSAALSFGTVASPVAGKPIESNDPGLTDRVHSLIAGTGTSVSGAQGDVTIGLVFDTDGTTARAVSGLDVRLTELVKNAVAGSGILVSSAQGDVTFSLNPAYTASSSEGDNHPGLMSVSDKNKLDGLSEPITIHTELSGLTADDHPQYLLVDSATRTLLVSLTPKIGATVALGAANIPFNEIFSSAYKGVAGEAATLPDGINLSGGSLKNVRVEGFTDTGKPGYSIGRLIYTTDTGKLLFGSPTAFDWVNLREIPVASVVGHGDVATVHVTSGERAALAGSSGVPGAGNRFVTQADTGLLSGGDRTKLSDLLKVYDLEENLIGPFTTIRLSGGVNSIAADVQDSSIVNIEIASGTLTDVQATDTTILSSVADGVASVQVKVMPGLVAGATGVQLDLGSGLEIDGNSKLGAKTGSAAGTVCAGDDARLSDARPVSEGNQTKIDGALQRAGGTMSGAIDFNGFAGSNFVLLAPVALPASTAPGGKLVYFESNLYLDNGTGLLNLFARANHTGTQALSTISDHNNPSIVHLSVDEKAAIVGTSGTPSAANKFVTSLDPRMAGATEVARLSNLLSLKKEGVAVDGGVVSTLNFTGAGTESISISSSGEATATAHVAIRAGVASVSKEALPGDAEEVESITSPPSIMVVGPGVKLYQQSSVVPSPAVLEITGTAPNHDASLTGDGTVGTPLGVVFSSNGVTTPAAVDNTDARLTGNAKLEGDNSFTGKNSFADISSFLMPQAGPSVFFGQAGFGGSGDSDGFLTVGTTQQAGAYVTALEWNRNSTAIPFWDLTVINNENERYPTDTWRLRRQPLPVTALPAVDVLRVDESGNLYLGPGSTTMVWGTSGSAGLFVNTGSTYFPSILFNAVTKRWEYTIGGDATSNPVNPPNPSRIIEVRVLENNGLLATDKADSGAGEYLQLSLEYAASGASNALPVRADDKRLLPTDVDTTGDGATNPTSIPGLMSVADKNTLAAISAVTLVPASTTVQGIVYLTATPWVTQNPTAVSLGGLAYDPRRLRNISFGGENTSQVLVDKRVWEWNGFSWMDASPRDAQGAFVEAYPDARSGHAFLYFPPRNRVFMHGGWLQNEHAEPSNETWEWDGANWYPVTTVNSPTLAGHKAIYDSVRKVVVVYGVEEGASKTYELSWDGQVWTWADVTPETSPAPRNHPGLAFDVSQGKTVLFGGERLDIPGTHFSDTWTWNGTVWTQLNPASSPTSRMSVAMAYLPSTSRVVLFGGNDSGNLNDTWTLNTGTSTWTQQTFSAGVPTARSLAGLVYNSARTSLLLYGGGTNQTVWEYNGTTWINLPAGQKPAAVSDNDPRIATAFPGIHDHSDDGYGGSILRLPESGILLFPKAAAPPENRAIVEIASGDLQYKTAAGDLRTLATLPSASPLVTASADLSGVAYLSESPEVESIPSARTQAVGAYHPKTNRCVLFGGQNTAGTYNKETWEWSGTNWLRKIPTAEADAGFKARVSASLITDPLRNRLFLHAGRYGNVKGELLSDAYTWDGSDWTAVSYVVSSNFPSPRWGHAVAYDSVRGVAVLFGGWDAVTGTVLTDTWEFDGAEWAQIQVPGTADVDYPLGRGGHSLTFDPDLGVVRLFGGSTSSGVAPTQLPTGARNDTWEWDGGTWTKRQIHDNTRFPKPAVWSGIVYDTIRDKAYLFGGEYQDPNTFELFSWGVIYEWNNSGSTWDALAPGGAKPDDRAGHVLVFDSAREVAVLYGGFRWTVINMTPTKVYSTETWEWDGVTWTKKTPVANPGEKTRNAAAFDASRNVVTIFGNDDSTLDNELWEYDGNNWVQNSPTGSEPAPVDSSELFYNINTEVLTLVGGWTSSGTGNNDTWTFNGTAWSQVLYYPPPKGRSRFGMAHDPGVDKLYIFAGITVDADSGDEVQGNDIWEFDPVTRRWLPLNPGTPPGARVDPAVCYFPAISKTVVFGGYSTSLEADYAETWTWTGSTRTWTAVSAGSPTLSTPKLAYDIPRNILVLTGTAVGGATETWEWPGTGNWVKIVSTRELPAGRADQVIIAQPPLGRVLLFGGFADAEALQDTWIWNGKNWNKRRKGEDLEDSQATAPTDSDPRLEDARSPLPHDHSSALFGGTEIRLPASGVLLLPTGDPVDNREISESADAGNPLKYRTSAGALKILGSVRSVTAGSGLLRSDSPGNPITETGTLAVDFALVSAVGHDHDADYGRLDSINTWAEQQTFSDGVKLVTGELKWDAGSSRVRFSHDAVNFQPLMLATAGTGLAEADSLDGSLRTLSTVQQAPISVDGFGLQLDYTGAFKLTADALDLDLTAGAAGKAAEADKVLYKDGTTTATAQIPFAEGLTVPDGKKVKLPLNTTTPDNLNIWIDDSVVGSGELRFKDKAGVVIRVAVNTGAAGPGTINKVTDGSTDVDGATVALFAKGNTDPEGMGIVTSESPAGTARVLLTAIQKIITDSTLTGDGRTGTPVGLKLDTANTWSVLQTFSSGVNVSTRLGLPSGGAPANARDIKENTGKLEYRLADDSATKTVLFQEDLVLADASWPVGWDTNIAGDPESGATAGKTTIEVRNLPAEIVALTDVVIDISQSIEHADDLSGNLWASVGVFAVDRRAGQTVIAGGTLTIIIRHAGSALAANTTVGPFFRYTVRRR